MKRTRLLAVVAALGLGASILGLASANASTAPPPLAEQAAQQLRYDVTHHNAITISLQLVAHASKEHPDADSKCASTDHVEVCFSITGSGLTLGSMLAGYRNISRGGFEAFDAIEGPANFLIATTDATLANGVGLNVGWLQSTPSVGGYYSTAGFWVDGDQAIQVGPAVCIHVFA
jgi:hypothetical protein